MWIKIESFCSECAALSIQCTNALKCPSQYHRYSTWCLGKQVIWIKKRLPNRIIMQLMTYTKSWSHCNLGALHELKMRWAILIHEGDLGHCCSKERHKKTKWLQKHKDASANQHKPQVSTCLWRFNSLNPPRKSYFLFSSLTFLDSLLFQPLTCYGHSCYETTKEHFCLFHSDFNVIQREYFPIGISAVLLFYFIKAESDSRSVLLAHCDFQQMKF